MSNYPVCRLDLVLVSAMEPAQSILVVDDDREIRALVAEYLDETVHLARRRRWRGNVEHPCGPPPSVVLDLTLPGGRARFANRSRGRTFRDHAHRAERRSINHRLGNGRRRLLPETV